MENVAVINALILLILICCCELYLSATETLTSFREMSLTLSQTSNFRLFQTERLCRRQFQV